MTDVSSLPHNAFVVFHREENEAGDVTDEAAKELADVLRNLGRDDVIVAVLDHDQQVDVLDEDLMRTHGWVRRADE